MTESASEPLHITEHSSAYWTAVIDNPPLNLVDPELHAALRVLMDRIETSPSLRVVVFESANPEFFIAHYDVQRGAGAATGAGGAPMSEWPELVIRLAQSPVISIAVIRGRARGLGSEFALACDLRFASLERAILGQPEVGVGLVPAGGGLELLPPLVGRARALEIAVGAHDFDAATAERYGWVNRAIPDAQLDDFVSAFSWRVAGFDAEPIRRTKELINARCGIASADAISQAQRDFGELLRSDATWNRLATLSQRGFQQVGDVELRLGHHVGLLDAAATTAPDAT